jgi:chromosome segregation ATPase
MSTAIDGVLSKSADAAREIAQLKTERDDLSSRLQRSVQTNRELEIRLRELQVASVPESSDMSTGLRQQKRALEQRVRALESELEKQRQQSSQLRSNCDQHEFQLETIFHAASKYFGMLIDSHQPLLQCFIQPSALDDYDNLSRANARLNSQLQKSRTANASFEMVKQRLEMELSVATNQLSQSEGETNREISLLEARVKDQVKLIASLTRERDALMAEGHEKTTQLKISGIKADDARNAENIALANELADAAEKVNGLINDKHELEKRILTLSTKCETAEKRCSGLESNLRKLQQRNASSKSDHAKIAATAAESEMRVRELAGKLARAQEEMSAKRREVERVVESVGPLERQLELQGRDLADARRDRDDFVTQLHKESGLRQTVETQLQQIQHKIAQREREILELQGKLREASQPVDVSELAPASCWTCAELPSELHETIRDIGRSSHLQISTKIQNCIDTISKWFKARAQTFEGELTEAHREASGLKANVSLLLGFLKRLMPEVRINFDLLLTDDLTRQMFAEAIMSLKKNVESCEQGKRQLESRFSMIVRELGLTEIEEIAPAFSQQRSVLSALRNAVRRERKERANLDKVLKQAQMKTRQLSAAYDDLKAENGKLRCEISDVDSLVSGKTAEIKRLEEFATTMKSERDAAIREKEELDVLIVKLQRSRDRLEAQTKTFQDAIHDLETRHKERVRRDKETAQLRYDQLANQTAKQISELQATIRESSERAARFEQSNTDLESDNADLTLRVQRLETKAKAIQLECDRDKKALESQMTTRLIAVDSGHKSRLEAAHAQVVDVANRTAEAVMRQLGGFIDGMQVTEANFEVALQLVKRKLELMSVREGHIRSVLQLESHQSIEDGIAAISARKRHRTNS